MSERVAVFDCFSGIAGDMTLAALVDAGASLADIRAGLARLDLPAFELRPEPVTRGGMRAVHMGVHISEERRYQPDEMRAKVRSAALPDNVTARSLAAIEALETGEYLAHNEEAPHFHEVGGVDALVDVVGSMLGLESLGVAEAFCPVVTVGAGAIVRSEHGPLPASPGPSAAHILQSAGFPMRFVEAGHELVTPTGAAILAAVTRPRAVTLVPITHGAGAGTMDPPGRPNALRIFIGERPTVAEEAIPAPAGTRPIVLLEANIDDMTPALLAHARDRLLAEGALDAWTEPIGMKKGRAAQKLCLLAPAADESRFAELVLQETSTLGVRVTAYRRYEAARAVEVIETSFGPVQVKVRTLGGVRRLEPEFEDVRRLAELTGRPALELHRALIQELTGHSG